MTYGNDMGVNAARAERPQPTQFMAGHRQVSVYGDCRQSPGARQRRHAAAERHLPGWSREARN
ncbi:MAG: hypothetical protein ACTHJ1_13775 [Bordetella sp.]|uniref:hypothetical protein n=1 Tax=Bordetella sp. TaxID=28081 RepID=UPI003F7C6DF0